MIRCGLTTWGQDGRLLGSADIPLSGGGRAQVTAAAARLAANLRIRPGGRGGLATIHCPADEAARETARIVAEAIGAKGKAVEALRDPHLGLLEGMTEDEFAERYSKRYKLWQTDLLSISPPEGEPMIAARGRVFSAIGKLLKRSRSPEVAVVLHSLSLALLWQWATDRSMHDIWPALQQRPAVERLAITPFALSSLLEAAEATQASS